MPHVSIVVSHFSVRPYHGRAGTQLVWRANYRATTLNADAGVPGFQRPGRHRADPGRRDRILPVPPLPGDGDRPVGPVPTRAGTAMPAAPSRQGPPTDRIGTAPDAITSCQAAPSPTQDVWRYFGGRFDPAKSAIGSARAGPSAKELASSTGSVLVMRPPHSCSPVRASAPAAAGRPTGHRAALASSPDQARHANMSKPKRHGRPPTVRSIRALVLRLARKLGGLKDWEILKIEGIDPAPELY